MEEEDKSVLGKLAQAYDDRVNEFHKFSEDKALEIAGGDPNRAALLYSKDFKIDPLGFVGSISNVAKLPKLGQYLKGGPVAGKASKIDKTIVEAVDDVPLDLKAIAAEYGATTGKKAPNASLENIVNPDAKTKLIQDMISNEANASSLIQEPRRFEKLSEMMLKNRRPLASPESIVSKVRTK